MPLFKHQILSKAIKNKRIFAEKPEENILKCFVFAVGKDLKKQLFAYIIF